MWTITEVLKNFFTHKDFLPIAEWIFVPFCVQQTIDIIHPYDGCTFLL